MSVDTWQDTLPGRVSAGAEWLDEMYPGWAGNVNVFTLDLTSGENCVLGQVGRTMAAEQVRNYQDEDCYSSHLATYAVMLDMHHCLWNFGWQHGFCEPDFKTDEPTFDRDELYRQMTLLWISEIHARIVEGDQGGQGAEVRPEVR